MLDYISRQNLRKNLTASFFQSFPEPHRFNPLTGGFEVLTPDRNQLAEKIKSLSRAKRPKSAIYKVKYRMMIG